MQDKAVATYEKKEKNDLCKKARMSVMLSQHM